MNFVLLLAMNWSFILFSSFSIAMKKNQGQTPNLDR